MNEERRALATVDEYAVTPAARDEMVKVEYDRGTIETVKRVVFPRATDDELRIYLYKCLIMGVHPLSGMLIPVKYKGKDGEPDKLSFTTTIDCFRSKAQESGEYDGQDEPEYEGEESYEYDGETITHPVEARVNVYRKGISRPFVGIARWSEYYPGHKRGAMWRKMPRTMLSKCAEALAQRKAFPDKLGRVYAVEEMDQAANEQIAGSVGGKPQVSMPTARTALPSPTGEAKPSEEQRKKQGMISDAQEKRLYAIAKKEGFTDEDVKLFVKLRYRCDHTWALSWRGGENATYTKACVAFEKSPKNVRMYLDENRPAPVPEPVKEEGDDCPSFLDTLREKALAAGLKTDEQISAVLLAELDVRVTLDKIPPEQYGDVIAAIERQGTTETAGA